LPLSARELFARMIKCEAGGEGDSGMKAVASVIMNRVNVSYGEYLRVNKGDLRSVLTQPGQFTCFEETVGGRYNPQNVYNMRPEQIHYDIADWALSGNILGAVGESLWYFNPYDPVCPPYFPPGGSGVIHNRVVNHCFYIPTQKYANT
jgi:N-acetylmuramoyl-L-alanine amidase